MADEVVGELGRAARGGVIALVGLMVSAVFGFLVRALVGRIYGPSQYGTYNLAFTVFNITLIVVMLGFPMGIQRQISYFLTKRPKDTGILVSTALAIILGTSLTGLILLEATRGIIPRYIGGGPSTDRLLLSQLIGILALSLPLSASFNVLISVSQGFKRVREYVFYGKMLVPVLYFISAGLVAVVFRAGISKVVTAYVLVQLTGLILISRDLLKAGILPKQPAFSAKIGRILVTFSAPLVLSNIVWFIMTWTDTLMLGHYYGSTVVGIYNAASPLARFIPVFLVAFTVIYSPIATMLYAQGKKDEINKLYLSITKWVFLLTFPLFILLFAYPVAVLRELFGLKYVEAQVSLVILSVGFMFHSLLGPNGLTLVAIGYPKKEMIGNIIGALLNVVLNIILIPQYGMTGASIATAVSYIISSMYKQVVLFNMNIKPFNKEYYKVICIGIGFTILGLIFPTNDILKAIIYTIGVTVGFYIMLIIFGTFTEEDIRLLNSLTKKAGIDLERLIEIIEKKLINK
ncbi:flippase [Thermococcus prieurii]